MRRRSVSAATPTARIRNVATGAPAEAAFDNMEPLHWPISTPWTWPRGSAVEGGKKQCGGPVHRLPQPLGPWSSEKLNSPRRQPSLITPIKDTGGASLGRFYYPGPAASPRYENHFFYATSPAKGIFLSSTQSAGAE
jgi:hypothetical protein